jgi:2-polyprenyl-3-methyl-5-hydroxy-6-metoxy-1,4-benzoquinol methylase
MQADTEREAFAELVVSPGDNPVDRVERIFLETNQRHLSSWMSQDDKRFRETLAFVLGRFAEGRRLVQLVSEQMPQLMAPGSRVLDLGSGNGGVALPFASVGKGRFETHCLDVFRHRELTQVVREAELEVLYAIGYGEHLPYADESFDLVLYLETVEHVAKPKSVGREIHRILRPGGACIVSTPPRVRFAFRPDPHYGVRWLVLLPNPLQKWIVERVARKGTRYEVTHLYWTSAGVLRTLPGLKSEAVNAREGFLSRFLNWDLIVVRKH